MNAAHACLLLALAHGLVPAGVFEQYREQMAARLATAARQKRHKHVPQRKPHTTPGIDNYSACPLARASKPFLILLPAPRAGLEHSPRRINRRIVPQVICIIIQHDTIRGVAKSRGLRSRLKGVIQAPEC
jgi:hypothetical protein